MGWDEELDFTVGKKMGTIKKGRRAGRSQPENDDLMESSANSSSGFPPQLRKTGGWADETLKSAKSKSSQNLIEVERFRGHQESDDDIPVIPDAEEIQNTSPTPANAPVVTANRTAAYKEINKEILKNASFAKLGDIDLSCLLKCLTNEEYLQEEDEPWTEDSLFADMLEEYNGRRDVIAKGNRST